MRIAVTGATGMLGDACIRRFVERGDEILALARNPLSNKRYMGAGNVIQQMTDYSLDHLATCLKGIDAIVHLAAMRPNPKADAQGFKPYFEANAQVTENLLRIANQANVELFCQASSISVYSSDNKVPFCEKDLPIPLNFYGTSKLVCEQLATLYAKQQRMRTVSLRISQIVGNDQSQSAKMLMRFMALAQAKQPLPLWGEGRGARDMIYIKDVVSAIEASLDSSATIGIFNIGGGYAVTNLEIAETINDVFGNSGKLYFDNSRAEIERNFYMDTAHAESVLGWARMWTLSAAFEDIRKNINE